ncbi:MAG: citrate synthase/methylcitrate synthase [Candidatus Bipolaricaulota bacterium]|nr:citrate synthase/methylcitrate synthase [Candidatus Bipolaricaulota bacterium]MCS7275311.1 citrate synthase/methylcitrate synthase [Candidatus Bipolaricaulota bacterium]MDW8110190.1 citrate synthase/methylcitrate synthase [Candidatus Bipolaricaulota bacterium]MDW8329704.1 citrate synthase/methylcitrate synthase [Candidatus Bipolaricaulota bacterium]
MTAGAAFSRGLEGVIAAESALTYIDGQKGILAYLGIPIEELAEHSSFEETAFLLFYQRLPKRAELEGFQSELIRHRALPEPILDLLKRLPRTAAPMALLRTAVSALGHFDPKPDDVSTTALQEKALRLTAQMATLTAAIGRLRKGLEPIAPTTDLSHAANFLYMLTGQKPTEEATRVFDVALILHADHEFPASTFASTVVASTLSDIYSSICAALGALKGPLHGGANEQVIRMIIEIGDPSRAESYIKEKLARKEIIMGFGHRQYKTYDPRARILKRYSERLAQQTHDTRLFQIEEIVEKTVIEALGGRGIFPNVDFYSGTVYHYLGIEPELYTPIFAVSRIVGWAAHIMEYLKENRIFRPTTRYVGPPLGHYIPIEQRT